jgi:hypothetical protein
MNVIMTKKSFLFNFLKNKSLFNPFHLDKGSRHDLTVEKAHDFGVSGHILV